MPSASPRAPPLSTTVVALATQLAGPGGEGWFAHAMARLVRIGGAGLTDPVFSSTPALVDLIRAKDQAKWIFARAGDRHLRLASVAVYLAANAAAIAHHARFISSVSRQSMLIALQAVAQTGNSTLRPMAEAAVEQLRQDLRSG